MSELFHIVPITKAVMNVPAHAQPTKNLNMQKLMNSGAHATPNDEPNNIRNDR